MNTDTRSHVHSLIEQLPPVQLVALETILRSMLDPLSLKLALAPLAARGQSAHFPESRLKLPAAVADASPSTFPHQVLRRSREMTHPC
jgi:hypothetical protein